MSNASRNEPSRPAVFPPERHRLVAGAVPAAVLASIRTLRDAGGAAYLVGGPVRDLLLDRPARDWDIATDLRPDAVRTLFPRTLAVGAAFGTILVLSGEDRFEVTTFRRDGTYSDARRPDSVVYATRLEDDLQRRDFTVNAMAYDPVEDRFVDPHDGFADLETRTLRTVGDPLERFAEDGLRLLRAVRFSIELGLELDPETYRGLVVRAPNLSRISAERIREEFERLLSCERPAEGLDLLLETGLLQRFFPELAACYGVAQNPHHAYDVFHHTLAAVDAAPPSNRIVRLAALFHDVGKPETRVQRDATATFYGHQFTSEDHARAVLGRLRYPNQERRDVAHLVKHHMFHYTEDWSDGAVRRFLRNVGKDRVEDLLAVRAADTFGNGLRKRLAPELARLRERIARVLEAENALSLEDLAVGGRDLIDDLSVEPGPRLGALLDALLAHVLEHPEDNTRDSLLAVAETWLRRNPTSPGPPQRR